jgi:hypothetical protein
MQRFDSRLIIAINKKINGFLRASASGMKNPGALPGFTSKATAKARAGVLWEKGTGGSGWAEIVGVLRLRASRSAQDDGKNGQRRRLLPQTITHPSGDKAATRMGHPARG